MSSRGYAPRDLPDALMGYPMAVAAFFAGCASLAAVWLSGLS